MGQNIARKMTLNAASLRHKMFHNADVPTKINDQVNV